MKSFRLCSLSALTVVTLAAIVPWGISDGRAQTAPIAIQPDATLPSPSQVTPTAAGTTITGGTTAGNNLFHSFTEFSVPVGSEARFIPGNAAIDAIVTRVTGEFASQIDGTLAVEGNANLFLLNPNGVFFGPGASLDLRGAFVSSTANGVRFGDLGQFTADPAASTEPQLLTVAPSALFFNQLNPAPIENAAVGLSVDPGRSLLLVGGGVAFDGGRAIAPGGNLGIAALAQPTEVDLVAEGNSLRLEVPNDFSGAPLTLSDGGGLLTSSLEAGGGRIEVRAGEIALSGNAELRAETFGAIASEGIDIRGNNLTLTEGAIISASTFGPGNGGDINVVANRVAIEGSATVAPLLGTILPGFDPNNPDGVNIAPEQLLGSFVDGLFAISLGPGNAGNVALQVEELSVRDGVTIAATSFLPDIGGAGGNLDITATENVTVAGGSLLASGTASPLPSGNLGVSTPQLQVSNSLLTTSTAGSGFGGTLTISESDRVELSGGLPIDIDVPVSSGLFTTTVGSGAAGNLQIDTGTLVIEDGASAATSSLGSGSGGTLTVAATEAVELTTQIPGAGNLSASTVGMGDGGDIVVTTPLLTINSGGTIAANTFGLGNGGNITVTADRVDIIGQTSVAPFLDILLPAFDPANLGDLDFDLSELLDDNQLLDSLSDGLFAVSLGSGNAGDIALDVGELSVRNGAAISATSFLPDFGGAGGQIEIDAVRDVTFADGSSLASGAAGASPSGNIEIATPELRLLNSVAISAAIGGGGGGDIEVLGADFVELAGNVATEAIAIPGGLITATLSSGMAGNVIIDTGTLVVREQASVLTNGVIGSGASGDLIVTATEAVELSEPLPFLGNSNLSATTSGLGDGGDISITTPRLTLSNGGAIASNTFGAGNGGNITVAADAIEIFGTQPFVALEVLFAVSDPQSPPSLDLLSTLIESGIFAISTGDGAAGSIDIVGAETLSAVNGATISTATLGNSSAGPLNIAAADILVQSSLLATNTFGPEAAGDITIATDRLSVSGGGLITATALNPGQLGSGGNLSVTARESIELVGTVPGTSLGGLLTTTAGGGDAGTISIDTQSLSVSGGAQINSSTTNAGNGGTISVRAAEITLDGTTPTPLSSNGLPSPSGISAVADVDEFSSNPDDSFGTPSGNAGSIDIELLDGGQLTVRDGAIIVTSAGLGTSGEAGSIGIDTGSTNAGAIVIEGLSADGSANSTVSAFTFGAGSAGTVTLRAETVRLEDGGAVVAGTAGIIPESAGGNIAVEADTITLASVPVGAPLATGFFTATLGAANAGDLTLSARQISILDGALATTSTIATGDSGTLTIAASDSLTVAGVSEDGQLVASLTSTTLGTGDAGDLNIEVGGTLQIAAEGFVGAGTINPFLGEELVFFFPGFGEIPVPNAGSGGAGTATIAAETIELDNGAIGIEAAGGALGDENEASLVLNVGENLFLFNDSEITAAALSDSDGGNIEIDVSQGNIVLNQGSSIAADAAAGTGGNIQIDATGLFVCGSCSITASSSLGSDGIVAVTSPEVNPADSLTILPAQLSDSAAQIVTGCAAQDGNRFATVGRGGLPPDASDRLQLPEIWTDLRDVLATAAAAELPARQLSRRDRANEPRAPLQEAVGWHRYENGDIELLAAAAGTTGWQSQHPHCGAPPDAANAAQAPQPTPAPGAALP